MTGVLSPVPYEPMKIVKTGKPEVKTDLWFLRNLEAGKMANVILFFSVLFRLRMKLFMHRRTLVIGLLKTVHLRVRIPLLSEC